MAVLLVAAMMMPMLAACGEDVYDDDYASDEAYVTSDEEYATSDEEYATSDDEYASSDEAYLLDGPEDCLDGEEYDEYEQVCYDPYEEGDDLSTEFADVVDAPQGGGGAGNEYDAESEQRIMLYSVQGNQLSNPQEEAVSSELQAYQDDRATHEAIWQYFAALIPQQQRQDVVAFVIFTDGPDETLAAVEQTPDDATKWLLAVDIADAGNLKELTYTLVHEFGHLVTLNQRQVPPDLEVFQNPDDETVYEEAANNCPNYFPGEGCALPKSYLNLFYAQYWVNIADEWQEVDNMQYDDQDAYYEALDTFYQNHSDEFLTDYAATNPGEDIAETFAHFILKPKPGGSTIAEQKVLFFYDFPELVTLRKLMVERTSARLRRTP